MKFLFLASCLFSHPEPALAAKPRKGSDVDGAMLTIRADGISQAYERVDVHGPPQSGKDMLASKQDKSDDKPAREKVASSSMQSLVDKKLADLMARGSAGNLTGFHVSESPCIVSGKLHYEAMLLDFRVNAHGFELSHDETIVFSVDVGRHHPSGVVVVEDESFGVLAEDAFLHLGHHRDVLQNLSLHEAIASKFSVNAHELSKLKLRNQIEELLNDPYDNAILELGVALMAKGVSASSHPCTFSFFMLFTELMYESKTIDNRTHGELERVSVRPESNSTSASLLSHVHSATNTVESDEKEDSRFWNRRRRRQNKRCPYNVCNNTWLGMCGSGKNREAPMCIPLCGNCDCNYGCEKHDLYCDCHEIEGGFNNGCYLSLTSGLPSLLTNMVQSWFGFARSPCGECVDSRSVCNHASLLRKEAA